MSHLRTYRLPSFSVVVRECTPEEWNTVEKTRDAMHVTFRHKSGDSIGMVVQSPMCGAWSEDKCARSAISFASEESCWNDPKDNLWVREYGETLVNEAFSHIVLGKELRQ